MENVQPIRALSLFGAWSIRRSPGKASTFKTGIEARDFYKHFGTFPSFSEFSGISWKMSSQFGRLVYSAEVYSAESWSIRLNSGLFG